MTTDVSTALATLQLDPDNTHALKALASLHPGNGAGVEPQALAKALSDARRFHRERGDFELCVQLIDLELAWTTDPARRADLLHEKGRILGDELLRDDAAIACVREALQALPGHPPSTESLQQMTLVRSNWQPIARRYLQQAEAATDKALASTLYASVAEFHLKYQSGGQDGEGYLRKSLELDPHNRRSSYHLERLLREGSRYEELLALYARRADAAPSRDERALAQVAAGELSERIGRTDEALGWFSKALEANPVESRALRPVREALAKKQAWDELVKVLEAAARTKRGEQDVGLLAELAVVLSKRLGQAEQAEGYFRRVRKLDPSNLEMVEFYRQYYTARNELPQLVSVLAQAQKTEADIDRRIAMGIEMARAAEQRPQNADKAIEIWRGLLRLRHHLPEAVEALRRLYTRTEKWNALLELLKDDLDAVPPAKVDEKVNRYLEIVAIYRDRLNLDVMVVNTYLSILNLRPDHPQALEALAARYEAQGRWSDLIQILGRQAEAATALPQRVALYRRIASLWADKLGKHQNAVASLEKILDADPTDAETSGRLKDLYARGRSWRQLLDVYRRELPHVSPDEQRKRLREMAQVAGERLNDIRESIMLWNRVLAIADSDPDALAGLATLYERERRWPALVEILDRQRKNAEAAGDVAAELALLERRGMLLYEKMGASQAAIEVFRRIQTLAPQNPRAMRALREIYAQSGDYSSLEALYVGQGAFTDLCDQLTSLADRTADIAARTRLLERVAALSVERLNQPERALKAYERILATDPQNRRAALALVPLYRGAQKWPRLLATYEVLLGPAAAADGVSVAERLELLAEARRICEQRLASKGLAFQWCARAFDLAPKNEEVRADLERLAGEADEWGALSALYAKRTESSADAEERLWLLRRSLRVASTRLFKPADARRFAEQILAELGHDDEADAALEQILTQTKAWPDLSKLLHSRADRAPDIGERVRLLFRIAQLEEEKVADLAAAARTLGSIVEAEPGNERALRALVRVAEARQDWVGLVEALRRELALRAAAPAPGEHPQPLVGAKDEREEILLRIGQIQETKLADLPATLATYREVLQANPVSAAAVAGLERLGAAGAADAAETARLALPLYERTENNAKIAAAHEALLAAADTRGERVERLEKLRALYGGPLKNPVAAYRAAAALFDIDPSDAPNRDQLIEYAVAGNVTGDLVERVQGRASTTEDQNLRRDLLVTIAELQEQRLGRSTDAEKVYAEILKVEALHAGAFRALSRLYRDSKRWKELAGLLDARQAAVLDTRERLDLIGQIAELDESVLGDADHAIACYEKMLELDPSDMRAHRALDRHYAARERWGKLEELLGTRLGFASGPEVPELEFRRAELRATRLADVDGALALLQGIVQSAPSHEGARRLLEKLLGVPEHRQRVAKILEPLYEAGGAWARLVTILEVEREGLKNQAAVTALLARIADLQENKLQARAAALGTWRQILAVDPEHPDALTEIERLATSLERFSELVDVYQELAFQRPASDTRGRADLLSRAAKLYSGRLGNRRAAIDAWKLVLNLDVDNLETARPAAAALETLYAETGDIAALVKILQMQSRWLESARSGQDERKALLFRIAGLEEKSLGEIPAAVSTLRAILEIDPHDQQAIDGLERIFEAGAQHRQRVEILRKRIDLAADAGARQQLWRRVASLLERDVGDVEEAIAACVSILDENPEDENALETLARLYEQQGRHRDRLDILERRLGLPGAPAARVELLRQIAALLEGPLGDPAHALDRWREVLPMAPGDPQALAALERFLQPGVDGGLRLQAAQALEPVYERDGAFAKLAAVVQVYIESQTDARARLDQLIRLGTMQENKLRDPEAAFGTTALAVRDALAEPELPGLLDTYERLAGPARFPEVAALYREISPDVLDEGVKLRLDRFVADTARGEGDGQTAAEYFRRVLDRVPEDDRSLAALESIYRDGGDAAELYEILARRAELAKDPASEQKLRLQLGQLAEGPLERIDEAISAYERVLQIAPRDKDAQAALDRLYTQAERWVDLTRFLGEILTRGLERGVLPEREIVAIRFRLAQIEHDKQLDRETALDHLRVVLQGDPDHPGAIAMLEGMLDDIGVQGSAATLLEPVYAGRGDWPSLIKIGEIRLLQVEEPAERIAWTKRIARLYEEQLEDYESALRWYGKVFQEAPTERLSSEQLLRLAGKLDRWQDVANLFASYLADELSEEPAVLEIVRRTAEIFDLRLGNREEARRYYRRLYEARPDDRQVTLLFEAALERWEAWLELRELVDEEAGRAVDAAAKLALLKRSAKLDEERLGDRDRAIGTLREALEVDPADPASAEDLERMLREAEQWHDVADHLAATLDRVGDAPERDAVALRLADVLETKLEDVSGAVDRYAEILGRTPGHRDAVAALERIAHDPDHRYRVAVILEPVYRRAGDWSKLVGALDAELDSVEDRDQRVRILREMAEIYQRLGRVDQAFDCRSRAWLVDVTSHETLTEMEALARTSRLYAPFVAALQKGALEAIDPDLQAQLWAASARLAEEQLGDPVQAVESWRSALGARPDDLDGYLALERLLAAGGRSAELVEVLEKHLEMVNDPAERKPLAKRIAVLYEDPLKQREQAVRAWESVLEIDAADGEALDALAQLHFVGQSFRELADIYDRKILLAEAPAARRQLRMQAARLYDEKLSESDQAVAQLRAILDDTPGDAESLELLDRILTREERHVDLVEVVDARAARETSPAARDELAFRAARLTETELSDVEAAIGRYMNILAASPAHAGAREALWAIARGDDYRIPAVDALEPVLRAGRDVEGVVELCELRLAKEDSVGARLALLAEIARIEEVERRDPARAFTAWARALTEEATEAEPRQALERLAAASGDWAGLARVYEERMDATFDASLQRSLAMRLADLHENQLGGLDRAAEFLRKAMSLPGDEGEVLTALERVLRKQGAHAELADVLARAAEVTTDPGAQAQLLASLGEVRLRSLDDPEGALSAFRDALERDQEHVTARAALRGLVDRPETREAALDVLEPIAEARGDYQELVALYEQRLNLRDDHAERAHWLRRIAEVCDGPLRDPLRAIEALGRALVEEPMPGGALDDLERIAVAAKVPREAATRIEAVLGGEGEGQAEGDSARELSLRAARLYEQAGDSAAAERLYARVLESDPENVDALTALEALYRAAKDDARLAAVLERRAGIELDPAAKRSRLVEAALLHERLGATSAAVAAWEALRAGEEGDAEILGELSRLYAAAGQVVELCGALAEQARFADDPKQRAKLWTRVGELRLGRLDDLDGAADAYKEALEAAPEDSNLLAALEIVEERREDFTTLQEVLLRRLSASSGHDQVAVLLKLAKNAEQKLSDIDQAVGFLRQILDVDPRNGFAYLELERVLRGAERWYDLVDVLTKHADAEGAAGRRPTELALRVAIADIWERELGSAESAAEALEKVLAVVPDNVPALLSLARLNESAERWDDASAALERAASVASGADAAEIHFRNSRILRAKEASPEEVEALLIRALEADPTHGPALEALEAVARDGKDDDRLVQILELRLGTAATAEARVRRALLSEIAALYKRLGRGGDAVPYLEQLVALAPDEIGGREELADALLAAGRRADAAPIMRDLIVELSKARRGKEAARWHQRLGTLAEAAGDRAAAAESFSAAYKLDPGHPATLAALGRLAFQGADYDNARKFYRSMLLQSFDEASSGVSKAEVYLMLGRMHVMAREIPKARNMFERGLESDPKNEALKQALATLPAN
jgi:tetratricopeptide (TPR) repeat protein